MTTTYKSSGIDGTLALLLVICLFLVGCGGDTNTSPDSVETPVNAEFTLTTNPNPVNAQPSTNPDFQWMGRFTLTISETAGIGSDIDAISAGVSESAGGIAVETGEVFYQVSINADTNRVEGRSSTNISFDFFYVLPDGKREALVIVDLVFVDDNQFVTETSVRTQVN